MSLAKVVVTGTVDSEPEKRYTPNNHAVTNFNLAVKNPAFGSRQNEDGPFIVKVTCWRALADAVVEQVHKGDEILVDGRLLMNSDQASGAAAKKGFEIEANTLDKLSGVPQTIIAEFGGKDNSSGAPRAAAKPTAKQQPVGVAAPAMSEGDAGFSADELLSDDDIPF